MKQTVEVEELVRRRLKRKKELLGGKSGELEK